MYPRILWSLLFFAALLAPTAAEAAPPECETTLEAQYINAGHEHLNSLIVSSRIFHATYLGVWYWMHANNEWAEGYAGLAVAPTRHIQFGFAGGIRNGTSHEQIPWRLSYFLGYFGEHGNFVEAVGTARPHAPPWLRVHMNRQLQDWFGVGAMFETGLGVGPRLRLSVPRRLAEVPLEYWVAPVIGEATTFGVVMALKMNL